MKCAYISISTRSAAHRHLRGQGVRFFAPDVAFDDAEKYLPPLLKKRGKFDADLSASLEYLRNIIEVVTPELYAVFESSGCAVATKVIGRYSPQHSDWHVHCAPKMRIFSVLASPCGLQIESRFFSKDKHSPMNFRLNDVEGRRDLANGAPSIICG